MTDDTAYDPTDAPPDMTDDADLPGWVRVLADYARCELSRHRKTVNRAFDEGHITHDDLVEPPDDILSDLSRWAAAAREFHNRYGTDYTDREEYDVSWDDDPPSPDAPWCLQTLASTLVMIHRENCTKCRTPRRDDGRIYLVPVEDDEQPHTRTPTTTMPTPDHVRDLPEDQPKENFRIAATRTVWAHSDVDPADRADVLEELARDLRAGDSRLTDLDEHVKHVLDVSGYDYPDDLFEDNDLK